jgi:purine-binding chemotaxis protein CheW
MPITLTKKTVVQPAEGKYLLFTLALETYAVGIHEVLEILGPLDLPELAEGSPSVRGLLNLRGKVVPVIDLRCRLGLDVAKTNPGRCVLTVRAQGWDGPLWIGLVVDGIQNVVQIKQEELEEVPDMEDDPRNGFIRGLAQCQDRVVLLLDVDQVAKGDEVEAVQFALGGSHEAF